MNYLFCNPSAQNFRADDRIAEIRAQLNGQIKEYNILDFSGFADFFAMTKPTDVIYLVGGDGTLNHFINDIPQKDDIPEIFYYPAGTGNDFSRDIYEGESRERIRLNPYIKNLPTVTVNGVTRKFINGIGFGIDGYCCEEGDRQRERKQGAKINYTSIAIKGLLFKFKPKKAEVTVDGVSKRYNKVWLAPVMIGKYYGGGMKISPDQDRLSAEPVLTSVVLHSTGKLKTLMRFSSIFSGTHVQYKDMLDFRKGREIKVVFDSPCALQIDGETVHNVTEFSARI